LFIVIQLGDVLDPLKRASIMFDNSSFTRSEFYFTTLQLLRISFEWIRGSMEDLQNLAEASATCSDFPHYRTPIRSEDDSTSMNVSRVLKQNWKSVLSHQKSLSEALLDRIEKKTEEVKGLQDGVSLYL
jgi:hypothetical protein